MYDEDSVVETTRTGWFGRLGGSLIAALFGLLLFLASFVLLFWNEGRAVDALEALAGGRNLVVPVQSDRVDPANEGMLVHLAGPTVAAGFLEDPVFRVGGPNLLRLERQVEMFQWRETEETTREKSLGGSETTRTVHRYVREWASSHIDSSNFRKQEGHGNPAMAYGGATFDQRSVRLGAFTLSPQQIRRLDNFEVLPAPDAAAASTLPPGFRWVGDRLVRGADPEQPQIGDYRVVFRAIPAQPLSIVAQQAGSGLTGYRGPNGRDLELVAAGLHSVDDLFRQARSDEIVFTWILRGAGFLMMLFGVVLAAAPLSWLVSVVPFLEGVADAAAFGLGLLVATPLTLLTIALGWMAYRPLIGGGLLLAAILVAVAIRRFLPRRGRNRSGGTVSARPVAG